jgi:hypothetical protein
LRRFCGRASVGRVIGLWFYGIPLCAHCYWLTPDGVALAWFEGDNSSTLVERSLKIYPEDKNLKCLLETIPILGKESLYILFLALRRKGKVEPIDWSMMMVSQMEKEFDRDQTNRLLSILKNYPKQYEDMKNALKKLREAIDYLDLHFN